MSLLVFRIKTFNRSALLLDNSIIAFLFAYTEKYILLFPFHQTHQLHQLVIVFHHLFVTYTQLDDHD